MATVNIYDMADTWNDGGTTFTAIKMDVTDTASASGSLLMDLKVGGSSKFSFKKDGTGIATVWQASALSATGNGVYLTATGGVIQFSSDAFISRKGTANLRLGAADNATSIVAQTLSVQSVASGGATPNIAGEDFTIQGSAGTGLGRGGAIVFQNAASGSSGTGQNPPSTSARIVNDNVFKIGAILAPIIGTTSDVGSTDLRIHTSGSVFFISGGPEIAASYSSLFTIDSGVSPKLRSGSTISWTDNATDSNATSDTILARDAANTLALRNGTNAQEFRVYNTYTSSTVHEVLGIGDIPAITGNVGFYYAKGSAGGSNRNIYIANYTDSGIIFATNSLNRWAIRAAGTLTTWSDATLDIGESGGTRPRTIYISDNVVTGATDFIHETSAALTDGAGANTATLTNAPSAGNPTKWIAINDNGTTRYIPTWE